LGTKTIFQVLVGGIFLGSSQLWVSDGTPGGTTLLKDFGSFSATSTTGFYAFNNKLYFDGTDFTVSGTELWVTDGSPGGTALVKDINPGVNSSFPFLFSGATFTGKFIFTATTAANGSELWVTDGTGGGTKLFDDINPGTASSAPFIIGNFFALGSGAGVLYNGKIFFMAKDGTHGREPWITDGTVANTKMVKDILPGSTGSLDNTTGFFYTKSGLYFGASDSVHGEELWLSDGTSGGTAMVKDINPGTKSSMPEFIGIFNDHLYFTADDGDNTNGDRDLYIVNATTTTLPVILTSFTAAPVKNDVQLNWSTSTEINSSHFNIQKSEDGNSFTTVATVQAAGNSSVTKYYQYTDIGALVTNAPMLYYRLQTNDQDGRVDYSRVVSVPINKTPNGLIIYPNPAKDVIQFAYTLQNVQKPTMRIIDADGKIVRSGLLGNTQNANHASVNISTLPAGVYYLQVINGKNVQTARFVKQ
jgi:ELWxxDGT repeat protein